MTLLPRGLKVHLALGYTDMQLCGAHDYAESVAAGGISPLFSNRLI